MKLKIFTLVRFRRMQTFFEDRMLVSKFRLFIADFGFTLKALWLKRKSILLFKIYLDAWTETEGATSRSELAPDPQPARRQGSVHFQNLIASLKELRHEVDPNHDRKKVQK